MAIHRNFDALGNAQPNLSQRPDGGHLCAANPGPEGAHHAGVGGVRIGPQHDLPGKGEPFFDQKLMANAAPDIEEIFDPLIGDKLADDAVILGVFGRRRRGGVIQNHGVHSGIKDALSAHALKDAIDRGGVVMRESHIWRNLNDLARGGAIKPGFLG